MKCYINVTFSKLMAFLILVSGSIFSILYNEATVITFAITASAGLIGWRQQKQKEIKKNEGTNKDS